MQSTPDGVSDGSVDAPRPGGPGSDLVGRLGRVTIAVPGGDRSGEVAVRLDDGRIERLLACAAQPLAPGTEVLVVNYRGRRRVDVQAWTLGGFEPAST